MGIFEWNLESRNAPSLCSATAARQPIFIRPGSGWGAGLSRPVRPA